MRQKTMISRLAGDVRRENPRALVMVFFGALCEALRPYVYVVASALLVRALRRPADAALVAVLAVAAPIAAALFSLGARWCDEWLMAFGDATKMEETSRFVRRVFAMPMAAFLRPSFADRADRVRTLLETEGGLVRASLYRLRDIVRFGLGVAAGLAALWPFWRALLGATPQSASLRGPVLGLIAVSVSASLLLHAARKRMQHTNDHMRARYDAAFSRFRYFRERMADVETAKEIRVNKEEAYLREAACGDLRHIAVPVAASIARREAASDALGLGATGFLSMGWIMAIVFCAARGAFAPEDALIATGSVLLVLEDIRCAVGALADAHQLLPYRFSEEETAEHAGASDAQAQEEHPAEGGEWALDFSNVTFTYPGSDAPALQGASLKLRRGEHLAVVGPNGSGKTTFVLLAAGMLTPQSGSVVRSGRALPVFQDYALFAYPMGENVAADARYDAHRVQTAMRRAGFPEAIGPDRSWTKILDAHGVELSGGEAHKLALARALYAEGDIFLLDEPAASYDPRSEADFYRAFAELCAGKTAIFISHKMSAVMLCDRIAVFDGGQIVAVGRHAELLESCPLYAALWRAQARYFVDEDTGGKR